MAEILAIRLQSGFDIDVRRWLIHRTYEGLVEGVPSSDINARIRIDAATSGRTFVAMAPHVLLEPRVRQRQLRERTYPLLPSFVIHAHFVSLKPAADEYAHGSHLTLTWFQDTPQIAPETGVLDQIRKLDWPALSADFEY